MVWLQGWALARVVIPESSHPFTKYFANAEVLLVKVGFHSQLIEARWRWSSVEDPLSSG